MASNMEIELALTNLEAGKFSFRMVDAIKDRLEKLEKEVTLLQGLQGGLLCDLRQQQIANWRLEGEATRLNAKIQSLLKANALAEQASRATASVASRTGESLRLLQERATPAATRMLEKSIDAMAVLAVKLIRFVHKAGSPAAKMEESLEILKKQANASLEKTSSQISASGKTAA
ncbi:MAG TPA: hypothetical protein VMJ31_09830 [Methylocystis sp.]|nr:hypothetical protein [Methylocystis sp.]